MLTGGPDSYQNVYLESGTELYDKVEPELGEPQSPLAYRRLSQAPSYSH